MYTIIWSFRVQSERDSDFKRAYGPDGEWVHLFRKGEGFVGTELLFDGTRYVTIDRWKTETDYRLFRKNFEEHYSDLDKRLGALTIEEVHVGSFETA